MLVQPIMQMLNLSVFALFYELVQLNKIKPLELSPQFAHNSMLHKYLYVNIAKLCFLCVCDIRLT